MFDSHVHFDADVFRDDLDLCAHRTREAGIVAAVNPSIHLPSSKQVLDIHRRHRWILPSLGFHPLYLDPHLVPPQRELRALLQAHPEYVAVGEIGLDFWHGRGDEDRQREFLFCQARLAREFGLPLLLHIRKAFYETFAVVREAGFDGTGVVHAFSGSYDMARLALDRGFRLSIAANITYPRKHRLREVLRRIPCNRLFVETDAPDLPPWPRKGRVHRPWELPITVSAVAEILGRPVEEVAAFTQANAEQLFCKDKKRV